MQQVASRFELSVEQVDGFEFRVRFDKPQFAPITFDEPPPLGREDAPNAARVLAAAVGNCLSASLLFCLHKAKLQISGIRADVAVEIVRTETRRLRVGRIHVTLHAPLPPDHPVLQSCAASFEDFCIVTQSVRHGIDVSVELQSDAGAAPRA